VIRFYGYDENGNLITNDKLNKGETTSDPNSIVEKFIPFQIANINYKIASEAVQYNVECVLPQDNVGYSTARGTIPFNFQLTAPDIGTLFNGNTVLAQSQEQLVDPDGNELDIPTSNSSAQKIGIAQQTVTQGLVEALNQHQRELANKAPGMIPDVYEIILEDVPGLKDAKMKTAGTIDKSRAPMVDADDVNAKYNPSKQRMDTESKTFSISAGTQIVQLIDQVMKNSSYITAQQTVAFDQITRKEIQNPPVKTVQWFKITQIATPIGFDPVRNDYAYKITYTISRYQINTPRSPYFPEAMYRGVHKVYDYWFTGQNTEVINFEIESNTNYITPIGNSGKFNRVQGDARFAEKRFFQTSAEESTQGGRGESTLPAAQLASRLYNPADVQKCVIDIVGDPDWITQSEIFYNKTINLLPFEPDGSCNANSSEVLFEIRFNRVVDFDIATGLTPVYKNNSNSRITGENNLAEESLVFSAIQITNNFRDGKFTQRLEGVLRTFETAVDSPKAVAQQKNQVESNESTASVGPISAKEPAYTGPLPTSKPKKADVEKWDQFQSGAANLAISGSTSSSTPAQPGSSLSDTTAAGMNRFGDPIERAKRLLEAQNNASPQVAPKPGSVVVDDDAGIATYP